jgi:hypothetical protein
VYVWRRIDFEKLLGNPSTCITLLVSGREEKKDDRWRRAKGAMQEIPPTFCKVEMRLTHSALSALSARISQPLARRQTLRAFGLG